MGRISQTQKSLSENVQHFPIFSRQNYFKTKSSEKTAELKTCGMYAPSRL
jgi:hypothetical protein